MLSFGLLKGYLDGSLGSRTALLDAPYHDDPVHAGLPLLDCLKMITQEAPEPIKTEFRVIVDTQAIGMPLGEACAKLYERTPVAEANFFAIVVGIQQKAGGNLSEALGNLSRVLRDRKKMKAKIRAMSQEAKASAGIIGALHWAASQLDLPTLADSGYEGAGQGIKTPIKQPTDGQSLAPDNQTYNTLLRSTRCLGERGFALLTGRWRALQRVTVSPRRIGELAQAALVLTRIENVQLRHSC